MEVSIFYFSIRQDGIRSRPRMGSWTHESIIDQLLNFFLIFSAGIPCDDLKITEFYDPFYIKCLTIHAPNITYNVEGPENGFMVASLVNGRYINLEEVPHFSTPSIPGLSTCKIR